MDIAELINSNVLMLVPVINIFGMILKRIKGITDNNIPIILSIISIVLSTLILGNVIEGIIQGILVVGVAVFAHQLVIQNTRKRE